MKGRTDALLSILPSAFFFLPPIPFPFAPATQVRKEYKLCLWNGREGGESIFLAVLHQFLPISRARSAATQGIAPGRK